MGNLSIVTALLMLLFKCVCCFMQLMRRFLYKKVLKSVYDHSFDEPNRSKSQSSDRRLSTKIEIAIEHIYLSNKIS